MKNKLLLTTSLSVLAGLALLPAVGNAAYSNSATGSLQATIKITASCSVSAGNTNLDFGTQSATTGTTAVSQSTPGAFTVTCTNHTPYDVGLSTATDTANGTGTMKGSISGNADTIGYALYQDASSTVWGNSVGTNTKTNTGNNAAQSYTVYGKTTSTLNVLADTYSDTVTINVSY